MRTSCRPIAPIALVLALAAAVPAGAAPSPPVAGAGVAVSPTDRAAARALLAERRREQLARLHAYGVDGRFPHNYDVAPSQHLFRDAEGRLCAVANLVEKDGRGDLVDAIARTHNDLAVADVHDGPLFDWMLDSGLTQEELVRIQAPAPFVRRPSVPRPQLVAQGAAPTSESAMSAALRAHVRTVEDALRAATDASLDVAVARYLAALRTVGAAPRS